MQRSISYLLLFFSCIYQVNAQTGTLSGHVSDENNNDVENVLIQLKETVYNAISDKQGNFRIEGIKPDNYLMVCTGMGNNPVQVSINIKASQDTSITVKTTRTLKEINEVVVTATRTEKDVTDIPMPIKIISGEQIKAMGSMRLTEVLQEQTGLAIVTDHGTGIQMQGFNPDYTLIMIDGEPLIGRTAGTFDLNRIAIGNIKRIEIIKGPSSSLYGSEALAGVINIITSKPDEGITGNTRVRYGSNNTLDLNATAGYKNDKFSISGFANRYSTGGYNLVQGSEFPTVAPFENYTFTNKISYKLNTKTDVGISSRYYSEFYKSASRVTDEISGQNFVDNTKGDVIEWNINPSVTHRFNTRNKLSVRFYSTRYDTRSIDTYASDGYLYDYSFFIQNYTRPEIQFDHSWNNKHMTTIGTGAIFESVEATRYDNAKYFQTYYSYLQHDFSVFKRLNIIAGLRYDNQSVYGQRLSPKLSTQYKAFKWLSFKGSVGNGFKAPDFRQLYLNFTNPTVGYSVFGSEEIKQKIAQLESQGQILLILIDPSTLQNIRAEYSTAWNIGFSAEPLKQITWNVNFFRNDINDMIETAPLAVKTNGQSVYSYFNLSKVFTQGVETDVTIRPMKNLSVSIGYQYLEAKDKQVMEDIENGKYYGTDGNGQIKRLTLSDYGGLYNRSKHMANIRLFYQNAQKGWSGSIRYTYRGRYGYGDANGNLILDDNSEYVPGYGLLNASISKRMWNMATIQIGADNITDYKNPTYISSIPGLLIYASLQCNISNNTFRKK